MALEIAVVMVHVWDSMPEHPQIKWQEFSSLIIQKSLQFSWPIIWQFDYIKTNEYYRLVSQQFDKKINNLAPSEQVVWRQNLQVDQQGKLPHLAIDYKDNNWISTSSAQTHLAIQNLDPKIVMFGGLHKDLCVEGAMLDVWDHTREYFVSDRLSYNWKDTLFKEW
jgi:hypothetical protein